MSRRHRPRRRTTAARPSRLHCLPCGQNPPVSRSRHRMFTGLTCEHGQNCRAIGRDPWWTVARRTYGAAKKSRGHRHHGAAAGLSGPAATHAQTRVLHSVDTHPPSTRRRLDLGPPSGAAAELHLRTVDRAADAARGHHADVRQGRRRARRPGGPVIHSATRTIVVPSVIRLRSFVRVPYRARVPMTRAALMHRDRFRCAYCGAKADTVDHVVPRSRGGDHSWENCVAAARRATTARPTSCSPNSAGRCARCRCRRRDSTGGCCPSSRNSTPPGCDTWVRARPERVAAIRFAS